MVTPQPGLKCCSVTAVGLTGSANPGRTQSRITILLNPFQVVSPGQCLIIMPVGGLITEINGGCINPVPEMAGVEILVIHQKVAPGHASSSLEGVIVDDDVVGSPGTRRVAGVARIATAGPDQTGQEPAWMKAPASAPHLPDEGPIIGVQGAQDFEELGRGGRFGTPRQKHEREDDPTFLAHPVHPRLPWKEWLKYTMKGVSDQWI